MLIQSIREERRSIEQERLKLLQQIQEEREQGLLEGKCSVARAMLLKGLDVNLIVELTQLSLEEIGKLKS